MPFAVASVWEARLSFLSPLSSLSFSGDFYLIWSGPCSSLDCIPVALWTPY